MGKFSSVSQDYSRRFTDQELLSILLASLRTLDNYFKNIILKFYVVYLCNNARLFGLSLQENGSRVFNLGLLESKTE